MSSIKLTNGIKVSSQSLIVSIDETNLIATMTLADESYTASQDCIIMAQNRYTNGGNSVFINDVESAICGKDAATSSVSLLLRKGDVLSHDHGRNLYVKVFGLK